MASDDPRVHAAARACPEVVEVVYLEPFSSFYRVAPVVRQVVETLDDWLAGFAPQFPEALRWGCTVEGGLTSQRVQDALLLIEACDDLLERVRPAQVVVHSTGSDRFADLVLATVVATRSIPLRCEVPGACERARGALTAWFRPAALLSYRLVHLFRRGGGRPSPRTGTAPGSDRGVLFVLCSSARNHVDNVQPVINALAAQGTDTAVLTWHANERMGRAAPPGLTNAVALEPWVGWSDITAGLEQARRLRLRIGSASTTPWKALVHRGVPLAPLLVESLRHFLIAELPLRLVFRRALLAAVAATRPLAVKPWGAPEGFEYRQISQLWPADRRPLVFQYWLGVGMAWPYADARQYLDLFLAKDAGEAAQVARDYQRTPAQIELVGQIRLAGHREFADTTPPATSRRNLGLPDRPQAFYVGFDPNCALRGYQSAREQAEITQALLAATAKSPDLVVVVKPHPAYPIDHLAPLFATSRDGRVVVLAHDAPLNHFLNAVDLVVSKYSSILLEAALMRRVALAVIADGNMRFRVFGELTPVMQDLTALSELLVQLASSPAYRDTWIAERRRLQEDCLQRNYLPQTGPSPVARAATAIIAHARQHHSY